MQSKSKTLALALLLSLTSCGEDFDWTPRPWVGDSVNQELINQQGEVIKTDEPRFDEMTCFDPANIAELRTAISQIENKKKRKKAMEEFRKHFPNHR